MNPEQMRVSVIGMAWYLEEDFEEIKRLMSDGHTCTEPTPNGSRPPQLGKNTNAERAAPLFEPSFAPQSSSSGAKVGG